MNRSALAVLATLVALFGIVAIRVLLKTAVPTGPAAHRVTLSWHAPASASNPDLLRYNVYRSSDNGQSYRQIAPTISGTTYEDDRVEAGKTYLYKVSTVDSRGRESLQTPPVAATIPEDTASR